MEGYLTRWRIEEAIRFTKQSYNLEDIRVLTRRILQAARRVYGIASLRYYAIADGISYILCRLGKGPLCSSAPPPNDRQLSLSRFT